MQFTVFGRPRHHQYPFGLDITASAWLCLTALVLLAMTGPMINAPAAQAAMGKMTVGSPGSAGGCPVLFWQFAVNPPDTSRVYSQMAAINQDWSRVSYVSQSGTMCTVHFLNGATQNIPLRKPASTIVKFGRMCTGYGLARILVTDCDTGRPIHNALVSDNDPARRWFRGHPTEINGRVVVSCNCKGKKSFPAVFPIKVVKKGYQTKKVNVTFTGTRLDEYRVCLGKAGTVTPPPGNKCGNGTERLLYTFSQRHRLGPDSPQTSNTYRLPNSVCVTRLVITSHDRIGKKTSATMRVRFGQEVIVNYLDIKKAGATDQVQVNRVGSLFTLESVKRDGKIDDLEIVTIKVYGY